jgi:hypothetical protein
VEEVKESHFLENEDSSHVEVPFQLFQVYPALADGFR